MATHRPSRLRLMTGLAALALALALATYPAGRDLAEPGVLPAIGLAAVAFLVAGLARARAVLVPWVILLLGAEYGLALVSGGGALDLAAPLYAGGLFLLAELASWSAEARWPWRAEGRAIARRAAFLAVLTAGSVTVGALLLAVGALPLPAGLPRAVTGVLAGVAILGVIAALVRRVPRAGW